MNEHRENNKPAAMQGESESRRLWNRFISSGLIEDYLSFTGSRRSASDAPEERKDG